MANLSRRKAPHIAVIGGIPTTTSRDIAETFGKRHDTVLRAIANLECSTEFRHRNFAEASREVQQPNGGTASYVEYRITRDGFSFLCMGFTGARAAQWKERYIATFNKMADKLSGRPAPIATPRAIPAPPAALPPPAEPIPSPAQIAAAMALANAVAAKVQATVFSQVLGSGSWSDERWLLAFAVSHDGPVPYVSAIDRQAMVLSVKRFIAAVGSDLMIDTDDLAALAKVSLQRLSERMGAKP